jgi:hypothetical protein
VDPATGDLIIPTLVDGATVAGFILASA